MQDEEFCGAKLRNKDKNCRHTAGFRTEHPGVGRCYLHGGKTPVKHGLYSVVHTSSATIRELVEKHKQNPDPLNLYPELAQLRAIAEDVQNRWDEIFGPDGAVIAWHESFDVPRVGDDGEEIPVVKKPRQLMDFSVVAATIDKVGAMADRILKHKANGYITMGHLVRVLEEHGNHLADAVADEPDIPQHVKDRLLDEVTRRWDGIKYGA